MTRTSTAFASSLFGAGLALATLATPVAAQEATYWLNEANDCQIFRALSAVVPAECAQPGDIMLGPVGAPELGKSRGIRPGGMRLLDSPAAAVTPVNQEAAVQQANPPVRKSINARVQFEFDSFDLTADAKGVLDRLAGVLTDDLMRDKVVQIEGHADAQGSDEYNLTLSQLRARAVRAYLVQQHGISADRLPFLGKGESELYDASNPTAAINRRVVFTNLTG
ncbi:MAG TPA: OmpA family protein [Geminicoccaceae bacterium]|nr:OmpA family protein [Geminicoccaceae bacterium]